MENTENLTAPETLPNQAYRTSHYGKFLRKQMPDKAFQPNPDRLAFGFMHMGIVVAMGYVCLETDVPLWAKILCAVVAGHSHAILGFFAHEIWHGSVLKRGFLEHWAGGFFSILNAASPTAWKLWHNDTHHRNTQVGRIDPDALPYLDLVRTDPAMRFAQRLVPGHGGLLSYVAPFYTFTLDYNFATFRLLTARSHGNAKGQRLRIVVETLIMMSPWAVLFYFYGWPAVFLVNLLPHAIANWFNMIYIHSNHHLSPRAPVNDPLYNSLTIITSKPFQWFHGNFGYHVEHHLFPSMDVRYAPMLSELLRKHYGNRYQTMGFFQALKALYRTGTCYTEDGERLVDLRTGNTVWTLAPGRTDFAFAGKVDVTPIKADAIKKRRARVGKIDAEPVAAEAPVAPAPVASSSSPVEASPG
ncbi:MAG: fatty acid desaturase [Myxococcota bacterium]